MGLEGYSLVSNAEECVDYRKSKLDWRCSSGHIFQSTCFNLRDNKSRCSICFGTPKKKHESVAKIFEDSGYTLLEQYKGTDEKHKVRCPKGHEYFATPVKFIAGKRCPYCYGNAPVEYSMVQREFIESGLVLLSDTIIDSKTPLHFRCEKKGHEGWIRYNNFQQGSGCWECSRSIQSSKAECEIKEILEKENIKIITRDNSLGIELDLFVPDSKIGIEYCGLYWHSVEKLGGENAYMKHRRKMDICNRNGIRLITIFEDEWLFKRDQVIDRIFHSLGKHATTIGARMCSVSVATREETTDFLNMHHLQGDCGRKFGFKLVHDNEIMGVITAGSLNRQHVSPGALELKRLAFKRGISVPGGSSKLFKAVIEEAKRRGINKIISFCDLRWGTGKVYERLGFGLLRISKPTPHFTDGYGNRYRNQSFCKKKDKKGKLLTIYDCGHQTWIYQIS